MPTEMGLESTSSTTLNVFRAGPAALLLVAWTAWARRSRTPWSLSPTAVVSGLLMIGLFTAAISEGTARAGAANTAILLNTHPFWVLLLRRVALRERLPRLGVLGLGVGFLGVAATVAPQLTTSVAAMPLVLGLGAAFVGAWAWAAGTVVVRRAATRHESVDVLRMTTGQYVAGTMLLVLLALPGGVEADWSTPSLWLAVGWLALGTSAVATLAFLFALRRIDAVRASAWQFLVPVVAILIEIGRGNGPSMLVVGGMALTILGVSLVSFAPQVEGRRDGAEQEASVSEATA